MGNKLSGKNGISIKLITEKIKKDLNKNRTEVKRKTKNSYKTRTLELNDLKNVGMGLEIIRRIANEGFTMQENKLLLGEEDVSKSKREIIGYRYVIDDFMRRLTAGIREEYGIQKRINEISDYAKISQAARDGIIMKQTKRQEIVDGRKKEIVYDTPMTSREVINTLMDYESMSDRIQMNKLNNYLGLGLGVAGIIGSLSKTKTGEKTNEKSIVTVGTIAISGVKLIQEMMKKGEREKQWQLRDRQYRLRDNLLSNEQISYEDEEYEIRNIKNIADEERKIGAKIENKRLGFDSTVDLIVAMVIGAYIKNNVVIKENGKLDGKSLASTLVSLQSTKGIAGNLIRTIESIQKTRKDEIEFSEICKKVQDIISQMEEKVYPLEGAKESFDSISINNFEGKFYPKKNYETGKTEYETTIKIPEFSIKRGETILLSGASGGGKSTFLRLLKRGDINNRKCIELNDGQKVDNLGKEYISFRPSVNLGDENNILTQITGKQSITDLNDNEKQNLLNIMQELKLDSLDLLEQLASKKFMEFSTGQQRRLVLSKLLYRINDGVSIIIVDEPVGNVEDKLIREQLEIIKKYAESKNVMLLLTTHRLDLAEDLATKRYHINDAGVLERVLVMRKEAEEPSL